MHGLQIRAAAAHLRAVFRRLIKQDGQGFADLRLVESHLLGIQNGLQFYKPRLFDRLIDLLFIIGRRCAGARAYLNESCA